MLVSNRIAAAIALLVLLAGCTRNTIIVLAPQPGFPGIPPISCWRPEDKELHYLSVGRVPVQSIKQGEFVRSRHQSGCAALVFKLDMDGRPKDIRVLREIPVDGGYGTAAIEDLRRSKFNPPPSRDTMYYVATSVGFTSGPATRPYPAVPATAPALKTTQAQDPRGEAISGPHGAV
jgi:hypothetical protein